MVGAGFATCARISSAVLPFPIVWSYEYLTLYVPFALHDVTVAAKEACGHGTSSQTECCPLPGIQIPFHFASTEDPFAHCAKPECECPYSSVLRRPFTCVEAESPLVKSASSTSTSRDCTAALSCGPEDHPSSVGGYSGPAPGPLPGLVTSIGPVLDWAYSNLSGVKVSSICKVNIPPSSSSASLAPPPAPRPLRPFFFPLFLSMYSGGKWPNAPPSEVRFQVAGARLPPCRPQRGSRFYNFL